MSTKRTQTPTLINLPPPPGETVTPSDAPGTPNSTTTSMSELSTVAIKDGHRGHLHHVSTHPMDAERADRISRLAGLDRLGQTPRVPTPSNTGGSIATRSGAGAGGPHHHHSATGAYFDANNAPQFARERSTVGSASATGSVGGRTTWASGSDVYEDKMSEDTNMADADTSSMGGFSDEGAPSLVGFGEGARTPARQLGSFAAPPSLPSQQQQQQQQKPTAGLRGQIGLSAATPPPTAYLTSPNPVEPHKEDLKMIDGMTYDQNLHNTAHQAPPSN